MPERQPNLWAEQEAKETGLDTYPALKAKLAKIDGSVSIKRTYYNEPLLELSAHRGIEVPKSVEAVYVGEFREDVEMLLLRVEKLQAKILEVMSAGCLSYLREKGDNRKQDEANRRTADRQFGQLGVGSLLEKLSKDEQEKVKFEFYLSALYGEKPTDQKQETLNWLNSGFSGLTINLTQLSDQKRLFEDSSAEQKLRQCKELYRNLLRQSALVLCEDSWNSPTYGSSGKGQREPGQESVPFLTDYQRNHFRELVYFQNKELSEYTGFGDRRELNHVDHLLFNNGFSAFSCMAEAIKYETTKPWKQKTKIGPTLITTPVYFEVDQTFHANFEKSEILHLEKPTEDELIEAIKTQFPEAVLIAPISNNYEMQTLDVERILEGLCDPKWQREFYRKFGDSFKDITLIIDNTMAGRTASWKNFDFNRLPRFIKIWSGESLIKYAQDGQEFSQAGLVTCIGEFSEGPLEQVRKNTGSLPSREMVERMRLSLDQEVTDHRFKRHSRNTKLAVDHIFKRLPRSNSFITEINYAKDLEGKTVGGVFTIGVDMSSLEDKRDELWFIDYQNFLFGFCNTATTLAREAGVELNMGTSFGFDTTRIAKYEKTESSKRSSVDRYYLRVAVGTENAAGALLVAECIARANDIYSEAIKQGKLKNLNNFNPQRDLVFNKKTPN